MAIRAERDYVIQEDFMKVGTPGRVPRRACSMKWALPALHRT